MELLKLLKLPRLPRLLSSPPGSPKMPRFSREAVELAMSNSVYICGNYMIQLKNIFINYYKNSNIFINKNKNGNTASLDMLPLDSDVVDNFDT